VNPDTAPVAPGRRRASPDGLQRRVSVAARVDGSPRFPDWTPEVRV